MYTDLRKPQLYMLSLLAPAIETVCCPAFKQFCPAYFQTSSSKPFAKPLTQILGQDSAGQAV